MPAHSQSSLEATSIIPSLTVDDIQDSIAFYEGLGFVVDERWEEGGLLLGAMMRAGQLLLGLTQDDWKRGRERVKGIGMRVYIETSQSIDELATRAKAAGLQLETEPHDTPWKTRAFEVTDPTGFKVTISSPS